MYLANNLILPSYSRLAFGVSAVEEGVIPGGGFGGGDGPLGGMEGGVGGGAGAGTALGGRLVVYRGSGEGGACGAVGG